MHSSEPNSTAERTRSYPLRAAAALFGVLILYALSAGPASWIVHECLVRGYGDPALIGSLMTTVYWPITQLYQVCPDWVQQLMEAYVEWWVR